MTGTRAGASRAATLLAMGVGALAISLAAIFFRRAAPIDPLLASALRLGIAALVLLPVAHRRRRPPSPAMARAGRIAGLLYAVHFGTWVASLEHTTVAASVTLVTSTPLLLAALAWALGRDRPTVVQSVAVLVAMVGMLLIGGADLLDGRLFGDALALSGAVAMAGYLWLARSLGTDLDPIDLSFRSAAWGASFLALLVLCRAPWVPIVVPSAESLGWVVLTAVVCQLIGHTLLTFALRLATPTEVGLATAAEPVLSTFFAWLWLAEVPAPLVLAGCCVTLGGVTLGVHALSPTGIRPESRGVLE